VICPVQFLKYMINGQEALLALCADGWIRQWEPGSINGLPQCFEDEINAIAPNYVDFVWNNLPVAGTTIRFGTGGLSKTITAVAANQNTATTWGIGSPPNPVTAFNNLRSDGSYGFAPSLGAGAWGMGQWTPAQIDQGFRVTSTPGQTTCPFWLNGVEASGNLGWCYIDSFGLTPSGKGQASCPQTTPVQSQFTSRAFSCLDRDGKRYIGLLTAAATWAPEYSLSTIVNGANQTTQYLPTASEGALGVTKDRTLYDVQDKPPYVISNGNGDAAAPKRLDYSVIPDDLAAGSQGAAIYLDPQGVNLDQTQDTVERIDVDERGYWMQVQFKNYTGTHEVKAILMEILRGDRESGAHV